MMVFTRLLSVLKVVALLDANDLQLQAIAAIADPIRPDVPAAVQECRHAGLEVKVVAIERTSPHHSIGDRLEGIIEQGHIRSNVFFIRADTTATPFFFSFSR